MLLKRLFYYCLLAASPLFCQGWGFWAHREINEKAVYALPPGLIAFYKTYLPFIKEQAPTADKRRYVVVEEAPRHYINLERYQKGLPYSFQEATALYGTAALQLYGTLPWHILHLTYQLTHAFAVGDVKRILRLSADLGHYVGDLHVPLHTTENYNGQLTNQHGIHAFWESRLPELFSNEYNYFVGPATYLDDLPTAIWATLYATHALAKELLALEASLGAAFIETQKYAFEKRGTTIRKMHSRAYAAAFHHLLRGMVANQMRAAIKLLAAIWYTCWVNAGQPSLDTLLAQEMDTEELAESLPPPPAIPLVLYGHVD